MSRRLSTLLLALLLACPGLARQEPVDPYDAAFERAMAAYQQGRYATAAQLWKECLEARPKDPRSAFNIACMHALAREVDAGIEWLERAAGWGFGLLARDHRQMHQDEDLEALRGDARFAKLLERVDADRARVEAYVGELSVFAPADAADPPLLVVLHARGATREQVVEAGSRWRRLAEELGAVLVAPSAQVPTARDPAEGMAWLEYPAQLQLEPREVERGLGTLVRKAREARDVDRRKVLLAGEGEGAAVAFDLALRSPGLFRGVVALRPTVVAPDGQAGDNAGRLGLRAHLIWTLPAEVDAAQVAKLGAWMGERHIAGGARLVEVEDEEALDALLLETLRALASD